MLTLNDIKAGAVISGIELGRLVAVVAVVPHGESVQAIYKLPDGTLGERLILEADAKTLGFGTAEWGQ